MNDLTINPGPSGSIEAYGHKTETRVPTEYDLVRSSVGHSKLEVTERPGLDRCHRVWLTINLCVNN